MNRYTDLSVARFDPLSMQEIFAVPGMKRQQHNAMLAQQQQLLSGLAKVDPHDKYYEEALRLKQDLTSSIDKSALQLAQQGVNSNSMNEVLALNRQFQDITSPTGKLGMINQHKINVAKTTADYIAESIKANNSPDVAKAHAQIAMKKHMSEPLYDDKGRVIDYKIDTAPVEFVDIPKRFQEYLKGSGMTSDQWSKAAGALSFDQAGNRYVLNQNASGLTESNKEHIQAGLDTMNAEIMDGNSLTRRSLDYNFQNPNDVLKRLQTQAGIYREDKTAREYGQSVGSVEWAKQPDPEDELTLEGVNVEGVSIDRNQKILDALARPDSTSSSIESAIQKGASATFTGNVQDAKITKTGMINSSEYKTLANNIARTIPGLTGLKFNSPEVQSAVKKYLEENKNPIMENRYTDPNTNQTGFLFASKNIPKDKNAASESIIERVRRDAYDMVDKDGKKIDKNDLANYDFTYNGDMTPRSVLKTKEGKPLFSNPNQNVGARTGTLVDKKSGEVKTVYISRGADDFKTPQHRAMKFINATSQVTDSQPNIYHRFNDNDLFKAYGMKNVDIKYNNSDDTYEIRYIDSKGMPVETDPKNPLTSTLFQKMILDDYQKANLK